MGVPDDTEEDSTFVTSSAQEEVLQDIEDMDVDEGQLRIVLMEMTDRRRKTWIQSKKLKREKQIT